MELRSIFEKIIEPKLMNAADLALKSIPRTLKRPLPQHFPLISHRGAYSNPHYVENTLEAFNWCRRNSFWGVELDIRWTKDKVPVVHHDEQPLRTFNKSFKISEVSFQELRRQTAKIPTLQEVIEQFSNDFHFMIELKTDSQSSVKQWCWQDDILKDILAPLEPGPRYHIMGFNTDRLGQMGFLPGEAKMAISHLAPWTTFNDCQEKGIGNLAGQSLLLSPALRTDAKRMGIKIGAGFIASKNALIRELNLGCDFFFTNDPIHIQQSFEILRLHSLKL